MQLNATGSMSNNKRKRLLYSSYKPDYSILILLKDCLSIKDVRSSQEVHCLSIADKRFLKCGFFNFVQMFFMNGL